MTRTPSAVWVEAPRLRPSRWAAEYYRKEYTDLETFLDGAGQKLVPLGKLGRLFTGPFGSELPASIYNTPNGIPLLRVQNIGELFLNEDDLARIPQDVHQEIYRSRLEPGDLALAKAGRLGALSRIPAHLPECNITQHIVGVKVDSDQIRGSYLAAFFLSRFGSFQLKRQGIGTLIKYLGVEETRAAKVPVPDRRIQDYIGAKVELAELCRATGTRELADACTTLEAIWAWSSACASIRAAGIAKAHLVDHRLYEDRLDPEFYQPRFLVLNDWLNAQECWALSDIVCPPSKGVQPSYDSAGTIPALTVTHVDPFVLDRANATGFVTDGWLQANARARIQAGELLFTVTGPPLGETVVVEDFHLPAAVNSHVARVRTKDNYRYPHLLAGMLNSSLGQLLTTRFCKGIRQKELYPEDFLRFRFPRIPDTQVPLLDRTFRTSCRLAERARALIQEAKADVEALIEGTLDTKAILSGKLKPPTDENVLGGQGGAA